MLSNCFIVKFYIKATFIADFPILGKNSKITNKQNTIDYKKKRTILCSCPRVSNKQATQCAQGDFNLQYFYCWRNPLFRWVVVVGIIPLLTLQM